MQQTVTTFNEKAETDIHAIVRGEKVFTLPQDLYIPPDALQVFLDTFEGPLDLLLYLIKRHNLDILDIPIVDITRQYMEYVGLMRELHFELAAEYLVMAAMLAEIKSRMLLPRQVVEGDTEAEDPRADLMRRLQEYERFKKTAQSLDELPRAQRDIFSATAEVPDLNFNKPEPQVELKELLVAMQEIMSRLELTTKHQVQKETLSIRQRMIDVLGALKTDKFTSFSSLFPRSEGRLGVVVTFIAILELLRQSVIEMVQAEEFGAIHVRATE